MIIDAHGHLLPEIMLEELADSRSQFPNIQVERADGKWQLGFAGGSLTRPIMPRLRETEQRFDWMNGQRLDHQVCGGKDLYCEEVRSKAGGKIRG